METSYVQKCITIRRDQEEFLVEENSFKLSKFVQSRLDGYIKALKENKEFMKDD